MRVRMGRAWRARVERHGYFLRQNVTVSSDGGITVIDMSRTRSQRLCLLTWKERVLFTWRGVTKTEVFRLSTPKRVNNRRHIYAAPSTTSFSSQQSTFHHVGSQHIKTPPDRIDRFHRRYHCNRCMVWRRTEGATGAKRGKNNHFSSLLNHNSFDGRSNKQLWRHLMLKRWSKCRCCAASLLARETSCRPKSIS